MKTGEMFIRLRHISDDDMNSTKPDVHTACLKPSNPKCQKVFALIRSHKDFICLSSVSFKGCAESGVIGFQGVLEMTFGLQITDVICTLSRSHNQTSSVIKVDLMKDICSYEDRPDEM